jgi:phosphatidylethanolamine/phosphatidyl-N-methylethanolamine N-methyltransferase
VPNKKPSSASKHKQRRHHFIAGWLRRPLKTGAVLPSSRTLAKEMAKQINLHRPGAVIELGAGTGVVTHALLKTGLAPERLLVLERDEKFYEILLTSFHGPVIVCGDAAKLEDILKKHHIRQVSAIVSSLPLITLPKTTRAAIVEQMAALIRQGATLVQFTFGISSPISNAEQLKYGISGKRMKVVMVNVPPAHVWVYEKLPA